MKLFFYFLIFLMPCVWRASAADLQAEGQQYQWYYYANAIKVTYTNPSASPITVSYTNGGSEWWTGHPSYTGGTVVLGRGSDGVGLTIPAGGSLVRYFGLQIGSSSGYNSGPTWLDLNPVFNVPLTVNGVAKTVPITFSLRTRWFAMGASITPAQFDVGNIPLAEAPPVGTIKLDSDAASAGPALVRFLGTDTGITILPGMQTIYTTSTPSAVPDGSVIEIIRDGVTLLSQAITKEPSGSFDYTLILTAPPPVGKINVTVMPEIQQELTLWVAGIQVDAFTPLGGTEPATWNSVIDPASTFPDGALVVVRTTVNGEQVDVGQGVVTYAVNGAWEVNITAKGARPSEPGPGEVLAELDLTAYDVSGLLIYAKIDGALTLIDNIAAGSPVEGVRRICSYRVNNEDGHLSGKTIEFVASGVVDGKLVNEMSLASVLVPQGQLVSTDPEVWDRSAKVGASAVVGTPGPSPKPDNPFDPENPSEAQERIDDYNTMRKAIEDALKGGHAQAPTSDAASQSRGTAAGTAIGALSKAGAGLANLFQKPPVGAITGTSALSITLPQLGTIVWDPADWNPWPGIIRAIALAALLWHYLIVNTKLLRDSQV